MGKIFWTFQSYRFILQQCSMVWQVVDQCKTFSSSSSSSILALRAEDWWFFFFLPPEQNITLGYLYLRVSSLNWLLSVKAYNGVWNNWRLMCRIWWALGFYFERKECVFEKNKLRCLLTLVLHISIFISLSVKDILDSIFQLFTSGSSGSKEGTRAAAVK